MKNLFSIFIVGFLFTNCTAEYQPFSFIGGGYENTQLETNKFSVTYYGNGYLSLEKAANFAHKRALEMCKEKGYQDFTVTNLKREMVPYILGSEVACFHDSNGEQHCQDMGSQIEKPVVDVTFTCTSDQPQIMSKI